MFHMEKLSRNTLIIIIIIIIIMILEARNPALWGHLCLCSLFAPLFLFALSSHIILLHF